MSAGSPIDPRHGDWGWQLLHKGLLKGPLPLALGKPASQPACSVSLFANRTVSPAPNSRGSLQIV